MPVLLSTRSISNNFNAVKHTSNKPKKNVNLEINAKIDRCLVVRAVHPASAGAKFDAWQVRTTPAHYHSCVLERS